MFTLKCGFPEVEGEVNCASDRLGNIGSLLQEHNRPHLAPIF
jgi:hypothetical protein